MAQAQPLATQISVHFDVVRRNYFCLAEQRPKLEDLLLIYCYHITQPFPSGFHKLPTTVICATWY